MEMHWPTPLLLDFDLAPLLYPTCCNTAICRIQHATHAAPFLMHVAHTKAYVRLQECIAKVVSDRTHFVTLSKRELLVSRCPLTSQFALILAPEDDLILQSLHPGFLLQKGQRSDSNNNSKRNRELACSSNSSTSSHSSRDLAAATSSSV